MGSQGHTRGLHSKNNTSLGRSIYTLNTKAEVEDRSVRDHDSYFVLFSDFEAHEKGARRNTIIETLEYNYNSQLQVDIFQL